MIDFICQELAKQELAQLASKDIHSVLISGGSGCGKSYLARYYSQILNIPDFQMITSNVASIRETLEWCYTLSTPTVICIENLDLGVAACAFTLLKFLEEPLPNIYVVVTVRNDKGIPDTIISRCSCVPVSLPRDSDIIKYATAKDESKYDKLKSHSVWCGVRSFYDVDIVYNMNTDQLGYFEELRSLLTFKDTISTMMWRIQHYRDNTEAPIEIVMNYIIANSNRFIKKLAMDCIRDLQYGNMAKHIVLGKFLMDCKYLAE